MTAREELASLLLNRRIAAVIRQAGLTQEQFALEIGVDRPRVNAWVKGRSGVSPEYAEKISVFATELYGEPIPPELFLNARLTPLEAAAGQLEQTGRDLHQAGRALAELLAELGPLLQQQASLVAEMRSLVAELSRREAASGDAPGPG